MIKEDIKISYVPVVDKHGQPLMPCQSTRVRRLRKKHKTRVFSMAPYTIQLMDVKQKKCVLQETEVKIDPGSKITGMVVCVKGVQRGWFVVWACHIQHRSDQIRDSLTSRRQSRHSRRHRKTRYRVPRFNNRARQPRLSEGYKVWLAPSVISRIENITHIVGRVQKTFPVGSIAAELNKFNVQKMMNSEITDVEYRKGQLQGFEVREYLLQKFKYTCVYCQKNTFEHNIRLEIDHVIPRSKGGSDRVNNLVLSCRDCNQKKTINF